MRIRYLVVSKLMLADALRNAFVQLERPKNLVRRDSARLDLHRCRSAPYDADCALLVWMAVAQRHAVASTTVSMASERKERDGR